MAVLTATLVYTAAGGMRAGLLAEATQGVIMAISALVVAVFTLSAAGGPAAALSLVAAKRPELLRAWTPDGEVVGLGWMLLFFLGTCAQPHYLQKFLFLRDRSSLRWMPMVMTISLIATLTVWIGVGLGGTALTTRGELLLNHPDQLAPAVLRLLGGPLMTLATLAVIAAVMSTMTSLLTLTSAAISRDIPAALGWAPPSRSLTSARLATVLTGCTALGLALLSTRQVGLLGILGWGMFTATLLPVVLLGLRWQGATRHGALAAMGVGAGVCLSIELLRLRQPGAIPVWEPGLSGAAIATLVLVGFSWLRPSQEQPLTSPPAK
jgi:sodium/proline symporter